MRELRNVLERAALLARGSGRQRGRARAARHGPVVRRRRSAGGERADAPAAAAIEFDPALSYRETRARWEADFERRYAAWLLARHAGNISAAARAAGMDRKYLHKLAVKHGIK